MIAGHSAEAEEPAPVGVATLAAQIFRMTSATT